MSLTPRPAIASRLLLVLGAAVTLGFAYWFAVIVLAPTPVPAPPPQRGAIGFDPHLDFAKNNLFFQLHPLGPVEVLPGQGGRVNPFVPVQSTSSSSQPGTVSTSSTGVSSAS